ncbi:thioredoxin family protein [Thermodesulfobacteriota bacterium]
MKVQILGAGCARCDNLYKNTVEALEKIEGADRTTKVEKIVDPEVFYRYKVAITPALVIDEEVISVGKLLTPEEIETELLKRKGGGSA